jgi:hypothetical protein
MSNETISAQDLRDFREGRLGPAAELYTHCLKKLLELIDADLRRVFMTDLIQHAKGRANVPMDRTFRTFAMVQAVVAQEAGEAAPDQPFVEPV